MARKSIPTTQKSPRARLMAEDKVKVSFVQKFRWRRLIILGVLCGVVSLVAMQGISFADFTMAVNSTFPAVVPIISKFLERVSESLTVFEDLRGNLTANNLKEFLSKLRREYGFWTVNVGAALVTLTLVGFLLLITSRRGQQTIKERKKRRRSTMGVRVVLSGSDVELSDGSEECQDDESGDECLTGPDLIFVEKKLSTEEYNAQTQATTNSEVVKLLKSPEFRQLLKQRGKDEKAFNWQSRRSATSKNAAASAPPVFI